MIQTKLLLLEYETINSSEQNLVKLSGIKGIKTLLMQIDFNAEKVPFENPEKLKNLLTSIKGFGLTKEEESVVEELITTEKNENKL